MNTPLMFLIGLIVLFLFFIFTLVKSVKEWRVPHLLAAFFLFAISIGFAVLLSCSLKTRAAWMKKAADTQARLETVAREEQTVQSGDDADVTGEQTQSIAFLRGELSQITGDRGRVWRDCQPTKVAQGAIEVSTVPPGLDPADAPPSQITEGAVLYVFKEVLLNDTIKVPALYLGEFEVTAKTDQSVTLSPTIPKMLDNVQRQHLADTSATWSLYDIMPVDNHRFMSSSPTKMPNWSVEGEPVFGPMDAEALAAAFAARTAYANVYQAALPTLDQLFADTIAEVARDGAQLAAGEEDTLPAHNVWVKVKFLKPYKIEVNKLDSDTPQGALNGQFFDANGRAVIDRLRRGENNDVEFPRELIALFPKELADTLIADGTCEKIESVFVRDLHDFDQRIYDLHRQQVQAALDKAQVEREQAAATIVQQNLTQLTAVQRQQQLKLDQDLTKLTQELGGMEKYVAALKAQKQQMLQDLNRLQRENRAMVKRLTEEQTGAFTAAPAR